MPISSAPMPDLRPDEHRVPRDVLGVALRVAVLGVDGEDQALEHVERVRRADHLGLGAGHQDRVAAPGPGLAQGDRRAGEELGHRVAVLGEPGDGAADRERQVVAVAELEPDRARARRGRPRCATPASPPTAPRPRPGTRPGRSDRPPATARRAARGRPLTARMASSPAAWPQVSFRIRKLSMSRIAISRPLPVPRRRSIAAPIVSTSAPWLSIPVNGSRRVASISATVWLEIRSWAARKTRYSTPAAAMAAPTVTTITSRRALSIAVMIGVASRQHPDHADDVAVLDQRQVFAEHGRRCPGRRGPPRSAPRRPARPRSGRPGPSASRRESGTRNPATGASLARTVPSGRRISARMMPRGVTNDRRPASSVARRSGGDRSARSGRPASAGRRRSRGRPGYRCRRPG